MLSVLAHLLTIEVGINPEIRQFGGLLLTWHGVFTALGIAVGVYVAVLIGRTRGFIDDDVYSAALVGIPCGIIGARALFVVERWNTSGLDTWVDIFRINEGGIAVYGAVLGGFLGGTIYVIIRKLPILRSLDVAACGLVVGMAIGRIGDIINGEHFAKPSDLPWAVRYTNLNSPSVLNHPDCGLGQQFGASVHDLCAQHPAVGYEMLADLLIFGVMLLILRFLRKDGVAFFTFLLLYSLMRFGVSELRVDSRVIIAGLTTPQVTSLFIIPFSAIGLIWTLLRRSTDVTPEPVAAPLPATGPPAGHPAG